MTTDELAEQVVGLDPTGHRVNMTAPGLARVALAGQPNPSLTATERDAVRGVIAAVLRHWVAGPQRPA